MNILLISSFLPYPLFSGGHVRLFNILKRLSKHHEVTLICEKRTYQTERDIDEVKKICREVIPVPRKKQWTLQNILKTGFSTYPFLMVGHSNSEMKSKIIEYLSKGFDLIHVETFYIMQNLPKTSLPVVLAEHNIEHLVYKRFTDNSFFLLKPFLYVDIAKMKFWEERYWKMATKLVAVSQGEKTLMERADVKIVANGVDLNQFKVQSSKFKVEERKKTILFIGDFRWIQNRDAVEWILKEIWPEIKLKIKNEKLKIDARLWIVGRNIPSSIKMLSNDSTIVFDQDTSLETHQIFQKADVLLSPTRIGGGTSYKILEAMASGVPVVTTPLGIEGIEAKNNQEVLLAQTPQEFSVEIIKLLENKDLYKKIAISARKLIEQKYSWDTIVRKLEQVYESVVNH